MAIKSIDIIQKYSSLKEDENYINFYKNISIIIDKYFTDFRVGRTRICFFSENKDIVIKIPLNEKGFIGNINEYDLYSLSLIEKPKSKKVFAPCRMFYKALVMKKIQYDFGFKEGLVLAKEMRVKLPEWAFKVDCNQVGMLYNGKLVAYDFG
jgi:hypothetical protein